MVSPNYFNYSQTIIYGLNLTNRCVGTELTNWRGSTDWYYPVVGVYRLDGKEKAAATFVKTSFGKATREACTDCHARGIATNNLDFTMK